MLIGSKSNFTYLVGDEQSRLAVIVDPAGEVERILKEVKKRNLNIIYIINTHSHPDHIKGNAELSSRTGAKIIMHESSKAKKDLSVRDGDLIKIGFEIIKAIHTPGHSLDSICLLIKDRLLTGDTLFVGDCGRTDRHGGNPEQMYSTLFLKLNNIIDKIKIFPGHDYGNKPCSTMGYERKHSNVLKPRTREEFVRFMKEP